MIDGRALAVMAIVGCATQAAPPTVKPAELGAHTPPAPAASGSEVHGPIVVDQAKADACKTRLEALEAKPDGGGAAARMEAGRCFFEANAIGAAIMLWKNVEQNEDHAAAGEAVLALAGAYERADQVEHGFLDQAAEYHELYAGTYARTLEAGAVHYELAMCLRVRAGQTQEAKKDGQYLRPPVDDPAQYCAGHPH